MVKPGHGDSPTQVLRTSIRYLVVWRCKRSRPVPYAQLSAARNRLSTSPEHKGNA